MNLRITAVDVGRTSFQNSVSKLPQDIRSQLGDALKDLKKYPQPSSIRLEKLSGYKRPGIYTIHITSNHSHKLSFELEGSVAVLRRVGTHRHIDRNP